MRINILYTGLAVAFINLAGLTAHTENSWRAWFLLLLAVIYFIMSFGKEE